MRDLTVIELCDALGIPAVDADVRPTRGVMGYPPGDAWWVQDPRDEIQHKPDCPPSYILHELSHALAGTAHLDDDAPVMVLELALSSVLIEEQMNQCRKDFVGYAWGWDDPQNVLQKQFQQYGCVGSILDVMTTRDWKTALEKMHRQFCV